MAQPDTRIDVQTLLGLLRLKPRRFYELSAAFNLRHHQTRMLSTVLDQLISQGKVERRRTQGGDLYATRKAAVPALEPSPEESALADALTRRRKPE